VTSWTSGDLLGRTGGDQPTAFIAGVRAEIDHPVRTFDHLEIVFDHQHTVAGIREPLEDLQQDPYVVEVQAGGGFVEQEQRALVSRGWKGSRCR